MKKEKKMTEAEKKVAQIKHKMQLEKTMAELNGKSEELDQKINVLVEKAKDAKKRGSKTALSVAKMGLSNAIGTKRHIEDMICQLDVMCSMKDIAQINKDFLGVVGGLCKDINTFSKDISYQDIEKDLSESLANTENTMLELDNTMNRLMDSSNVQNFKISNEISSEIDNLLADDDELMQQENELDNEISRRLSQLKA